MVRKYASQQILSDRQLQHTIFPVDLISYTISRQLLDLDNAAKQEDAAIDWTTLGIGTRQDNLFDGLLISVRADGSA